MIFKLSADLKSLKFTARYIPRSLGAWCIPFLLPCVLGATEAEALQMRVTLLGTSGPSLAAFSTDRMEAGLLVQAGTETLLFDCGRGVPERLAQIGLQGVNKVFLTHLHSDHTEGLPTLWVNNAEWNARGNQPFYIWGPGKSDNQPAGTADLAESIAAGYATNTHIRRDLVEHLPAEGIQIKATEIEEGVVYSANGVTVTAFLVEHMPVAPAFGYRVDYAGRSVVFSGDTRPSDNLVRHSTGADVLIHEVTSGNGLAGPGNSATAAYHTSPQGAADVFVRSAPRLAVYTHFAGTITTALTTRTRDAGYAGPLVVGEDLMSITIDDTISIQHCTMPARPTITSVARDESGGEILAGGVVVVTGSGFGDGGNSLIWTSAGNAQVGPLRGGAATATTIVLDKTDGIFFSEDSGTEIIAGLSTRLTSGNWSVKIKNGCGIQSATVAVTIK